MYRDRRGMHLEQHRRDGTLPPGGAQDVFFPVCHGGPCESRRGENFFMQKWTWEKTGVRGPASVDAARQVRR